MADKARKGRASKHLAKLQPEQVIAIRARCANGESRKAVGVAYGVTRDAVNRIVNRQNWKDI